MFGLIRSARRTAKRTSSRRHHLTLDRLETRCVMSTAAVVGTHLMIDGTDAADSIRVQADALSQTVTVNDMGQVIGQFKLDSLTAIEINGGAGNDSISVSGPLEMPILMIGGDGDDVLTADLPTLFDLPARPFPTRSGVIQLGGEGNDTLVGSNGRDLLIGGDGSDYVLGNGDQDILIGGRTRFDGNTAVLFAWQEIWTSNESYEDRVNLLRLGTEKAPALGPATVLYDGAANFLEGGTGRDWFFVSPFDKAFDRERGEEFN